MRPRSKCVHQAAVKVRASGPRFKARASDSGRKGCIRARLQARRKAPLSKPLQGLPLSNGYLVEAAGVELHNVFCLCNLQILKDPQNQKIDNSQSHRTVIVQSHEGSQRMLSNWKDSPCVRSGLHCHEPWSKARWSRWIRGTACQPEHRHCSLSQLLSGHRSGARRAVSGQRWQAAGFRAFPARACGSTGWMAPGDWHGVPPTSVLRESSP